jgi:hypothetical protein
MSEVVSFVLGGSPFAIIAWVTVRGRRSRRATAMAALPTRPSWGLVERPRWCLRGLRVTGFVVWGHDLLVGYEGGQGTWPTGPDPTTRDGFDQSGQLLFASAARHPATRELLEGWLQAGTLLTSVVSADETLVALVHEPTRRAVVAQASALWDGRTDTGR